MNQIQNGLPKQLLSKAYKNGWFKLFVKKEFNGLQLSLPDGLEELRKACQINGSLGWCVNLGAGANYFSGFFSEEGAKKIFTNPECVLAGSGGLAETVEEVENGFLISGKWGKATGALHATYFTCNGVLPNGETVSFAISKDQVRLIDDWDLFGMEQSSSLGFATEKAFVTSEFVFRINEPEIKTSYEIHHLPFNNFAQFSMTAAIIGLAEGITQNLNPSELKEAAQKSLSELKNYCDNTAKTLIRTAEKVWNQLPKKAADIDALEIENLVKQTGIEIFQKVNQLYFDAGLLMANKKHPVHESYKDFMLAIQHSIFK